MRIRVLIVFALIAASCGGGQPGSSPGASGTTLSDEATTEIVAAQQAEADRASAFVIGALGEEGALRALVTAWERGYTAEQLVSVGVDGIALTADGHLVQADATLEPGDERRGVLSLPVAGLHGLFGSGAGEPSPDDVVEGAQKCPAGTYSPRAAYVAIYAALSWGMSPDVIDAFVTAVALGLCPTSDTIHYSVEAESGRTRDRTCRYVKIGGEIFESALNRAECAGLILEREGLTTTSTTAAASTTSTIGSSTTSASTGVERTYRGDAEFTLVAFDPNGGSPDNVCTTSGPAEMIVRPDGTLTLAVVWTAWVHQAHVDEAGCRPLAEFSTLSEFVSQTEGRWSGTTFIASIQDSVHGPSSSAPEFTGEISGGFAVVQTELAYEGIGTNFVRVTLSMALAEVTDG